VIHILVTVFSCYQVNHPENGHMNGRNVLVTTIQQKYGNKIKVNLLVFNAFIHPSTVLRGRVFTSSYTNSLTCDIRKIQGRSFILIEWSEFSGSVLSRNNSFFQKLHLLL